MIPRQALLFRVIDIEVGIEVAGFVVLIDAFEWAREQNEKIGREVYEVREID